MSPSCALARSMSPCTRRVTNSQKKRLTITSSAQPSATMIVTSLTNTESRSGPRSSVTGATDEAVAHSPHRSDERRPFGIVAELLAKPAHQHVDRAIERFPGDVVRSLDDPLATQHPSTIA